jgi:hypothetical protein
VKSALHEVTPTTLLSRHVVRHPVNRCRADPLHDRLDSTTGKVSKGETGWMSVDTVTSGIVTAGLGSDE